MFGERARAQAPVMDNICLIDVGYSSGESVWNSDRIRLRYNIICGGGEKKKSKYIKKLGLAL